MEIIDDILKHHFISHRPIANFFKFSIPVSGSISTYFSKPFIRIIYVFRWWLRLTWFYKIISTLVRQPALYEPVTFHRLLFSELKSLLPLIKLVDTLPNVWILLVNSFHFLNLCLRHIIYFLLTHTHCIIVVILVSLRFRHQLSPLAFQFMNILMVAEMKCDLLFRYL